MHTIEIAEKGKVITVPECWDECTAEQAEYILKKAFQVSAGVIDVNTFRVLIFCHLTGFKVTPAYHFAKRLRLDSWLASNAMIYQLAEQLCSWPFSQVRTFADDDTPRLELSLDTVKNLFPIIKSGGNTFYGPADLLADLTFSEFRSALREMDAHLDYARDPETANEAIDALNRFMAVLYRPRDSKSGQRMSFRSDDLYKYAHLVKIIPLWQKNTTLLWFAYCVKYIQTEDINVDGQTINLSVLFPKSTGGTGTAKKGIGWAGLLYDIAKEGPFGDAEKTDNVGLFDILLYMYKNHLDNKEMERKLKSKTKKR